MDSSARDLIARRFGWWRADAGDPRGLAPVLGRDRRPVAVWLALPPPAFGAAIRALAAAGLPPGSQVIVEKPYGTDLEGTRRLNLLIDRTIGEDAVFRADHLLGLQTVQNVLGLRFGNRLFEPVWNAHHVERVEIVWDETIAVEGRAGYYDGVGALADMLQNHLLQIACLAAMEPPDALTPLAFRAAKLAVLRALKAPTPAAMARRTTRARYGAGRVDGVDLPAYAEEAGVDPARGTETFAEVAFRVDNRRWAGVPFTLRTGKALARARRHVAVRFRPTARPVIPEAAGVAPNTLRLELEPDRLALGLNLNGRGDPFRLERAELDATLAPQELPAYGRLLLAVLERRRALAIGADEAEASWRAVEPVLAAWRSGQVPLREYPAGSRGPAPT